MGSGMVPFERALVSLYSSRVGVNASPTQDF